MARHAAGRDKPSVWLLGGRLVWVIVLVPLVLIVGVGWVVVITQANPPLLYLWVCVTLAVTSLLAFFWILLFWREDEDGV